MLLLSKRAYASQAVFHRLLIKGYAENESQEAVRWLEGLGYLDDRAYARLVTVRLQSKGYGPRRISQYLQTHGLSREAAEEALECGCTDGERTARSIDDFLHKKASGSPDRAERQRLVGALLRRGFDYSDIRAGLQRLDGEDGE